MNGAYSTHGRHQSGLCHGKSPLGRCRVLGCELDSSGSGYGIVVGFCG